jgi:uncharacterized protein (DUF2062 family)
MFKRRNPSGKLHHVKELFWPSMGWKRAFRYVRLRIVRLSDTTQKIALGLALGTAIAFSPIMGTHFIQVAFLAWLLEANLLAALIGSFFGNPWTYPFIWWGSIELGSYIMSFFGIAASNALPEHMDLGGLWHIMTDQPVRLFVPWMIGGHILGFLSIFPAYIVYYQVVRGAKSARSKARLHKVHKVACEVTGQKK